MKQKHLYLILAAVGFVVPYYFFISFLAVNGFDGKAFVRELFANRISTFFAADLILSSVVFVGFLRREAAHGCVVGRSGSISGVRGCSSMAEHQLPKLTVRVRFPSPALTQRASSEALRCPRPLLGAHSAHATCD